MTRILAVVSKGARERSGVRWFCFCCCCFGDDGKTRGMSCAGEEVLVCLSEWSGVVRKVQQEMRTRQ